MANDLPLDHRDPVGARAAGRPGKGSRLIGLWNRLRGWEKPLWLALVVALFCVPLFVGLGGTDLRNDEAIYAYAVDSILETGDWLNPRLSPTPDLVFVEKPPLKFWLIALPMRVGLLPHNEFGFRFWDALFGSAAFLYVFALGRRIAGPLCGLSALLMLGGFTLLWYQHGLRDNCMDAPLVLAYCGGIFHFLRWSATIDARSSRSHAIAVGLFFVLGFMTKFVAVLFLPMILTATMLLVPGLFARFRREWRLWGGVGALVIALIVPWFAYEAVHLGRRLWDVMFAQHVVQRLSGTLVAEHLHPWNFYIVELLSWTRGSGMIWLAAGGGLLILARSVRERWPEGITLLVWFALPMTLISAGTSKLAYYTYPFLPPFALACGYFVCRFLDPLRFPVDRLVKAGREHWVGPNPPKALRVAFAALCGLSAALAIVTLVSGPVEIQLGAAKVFRNQATLRPAVFAILFGLLAARGLVVAPTVLAVMLLMIVPVPLYRANLSLLSIEEHPLRSARDCVLAVREAERDAGRATLSMFAVMPPGHFDHSFYFYLRGAGFEWIDPIPDAVLAHALHVVGSQRPVLLPLERYVEFAEERSRVPELPRSFAFQTEAGTMPAVDDWIGRARALGSVDLALHNMQLLLPGPYAVCGSPPALGPLLPTPRSARPW